MTMTMVARSSFALLIFLGISEAFSPATTKAGRATVLEATRLQKAAASALVGVFLVTGSVASNAYDASDYASETVFEAVQAVKSSGSKADEVLKAYENIAAIITEGKGVGGNINYQGVQLERGYIADEDTTIYNPGLTLLTESEKERLVESVIDARKVGLKARTWTDNNQVAYEFLKEKLDPLHMVELKGYLSIVPIYGAALYTVVLGVQQFARPLFPAAYIIAAAAIFGPVAALIAAGPQ